MGSDSDLTGQKRSTEEALDKGNGDPNYRPSRRTRRSMRNEERNGADDYSDHRGTGSGSARQHCSEAVTDGTNEPPAAANAPFHGPGIARISTGTLSSIVKELNTLLLRLHSRALAYQQETAAIFEEITHLQTLYNTWVQDVLIKDLEGGNDGSSGPRMQDAASRVQQAVAKMQAALHTRPESTFNPKQQFPYEPNPTLINELSSMFGLPVSGKTQGLGAGKAEMPPPPSLRNELDAYNTRKADPLQYQPPHAQQPMPMHQSVSAWQQQSLSPRIQPLSGLHIQVAQRRVGHPNVAMQQIRSQQQMQRPPGMAESPRHQGPGFVKQNIITTLSQSMQPGSGSAGFQCPQPSPALEHQGPSAAGPSQMQATDIAAALASIIGSGQGTAQTNAPQQQHQRQDAPSQNTEGDSNAEFARMLLEMAANMRNSE